MRLFLPQRAELRPHTILMLPQINREKTTPGKPRLLITRMVTMSRIVRGRPPEMPQLMKVNNLVYLTLTVSGNNVLTQAVRAN